MAIASGRRGSLPGSDRAQWPRCMAPSQASTSAAVLLGVADVAGKYYLPQFGAFIIYTVMLVVLLIRPQGLFAPRGAR